jgi:hypothetical protein
MGAIIFRFWVDNFIESPHVYIVKKLRKQLNGKGSIDPTFPQKSHRKGQNLQNKHINT